MKKLLTLVCLLFTLGATAKKPIHKYVKITTDKGFCIVKLYNETPLHRDNFLKLTKNKVYNGTVFHRVIKDFMIQGGDPDSKNAAPDSVLGNGTVGYTIAAEFRDSLFHKKGVIAAARMGDNVNPLKASSGSQFYLVQGEVLTDEELDRIETNRLKSKIPEWQRVVYKKIGGTPHLDRNYTVFGEIVQGLDLVDKIAAVEKNKRDRPLEDIKMDVVILKKREIKKLEKSLIQNAFNDKLLM